MSIERNKGINFSPDSGRGGSGAENLKKKEGSQPEAQEFSLTTGDRLVVYSIGGRPASWTRIGQDEARKHVSLDLRFISQPWVKKRIGNIVPTNLEIIIRHDRSDFRAIDPESVSITPESRKFVPSETLETKEESSDETQLVIEQKVGAKSRASKIVLERINRRESPNGQVKIVDLGGLNDQSRIYFVPVDEELEGALQIPGDPLSPQKKYRPDVNNTHPETGNIVLHQTGEQLIVQIDQDGSIRYLSSNFGKSRVAAQSAMELEIGEKGETVKKMIEASLQRTGLKPNNAGQIRHHLVEHVIKLTSGEDQNYSQFDMNKEREARMSKYPPHLRKYLTEVWYKDQLERNRKRITDKHMPKTDWDARDLARLPEELIEYIYNHPDLSPVDAIAEFQLLENDLHHHAEELIRKAGIGCLGEKAEDYMGRLYLRFFEKLGNIDLDDPDQLSVLQTHFSLEQFRQIIEFSNSLIQQGGDVDIRRRTMATHLAGAKFGAVVNRLGERYFDENLLTETKPQLDRAIDSAIDDAATKEGTIKNPLLTTFESEVRRIQERDLGMEVVRSDIDSLTLDEEGLWVNAEFATFPEYKTEYPPVIVQALTQLYEEYNQAFIDLVDRNSEWPTDYQYAFTPKGIPLNRWVQIDMVGLPQNFLDMAQTMPIDEVREILRPNIFEIENSLAMYQLLERLFADYQKVSLFDKQFRQSLDDLREEHGKPIALLAVTDRKHAAMRVSEFGKKPGEELTDAEVHELSGFDRFFSPDEFEQYLKEKGGDCDYLLYARTSDPVAKLKDPTTQRDATLLSDAHLRRIIRANSITFNVDNPDWPEGDQRRINDTKDYLEPMGMAVTINNVAQLTSDRAGQYLRAQGIPGTQIEHGKVTLRAKPAQGTYGCYGHEVGELGDSKFRKTLEHNIAARGSYIIQPERATPVILDTNSGIEYLNIDRVFLGLNSKGEVYYMGGFRSLMPNDTLEAVRGRNHGNSSTRWGEIT